MSGAAGRPGMDGWPGRGALAMASMAAAPAVALLLPCIALAAGAGLALARRLTVLDDAGHQARSG